MKQMNCEPIYVFERPTLKDKIIISTVTINSEKTKVLKDKGASMRYYFTYDD